MADRIEGRKVSNSIQSAINELRTKFVMGGEQRILEIEALLSAIREDQNTLDAATNLSIKVHSIAGIAPTLGFLSLGEAASNAERLWDRTIDHKFSETSRIAAVEATEILMDEIELLLEPAHP